MRGEKKTGLGRCKEDDCTRRHGSFPIPLQANFMCFVRVQSPAVG